MIARRRSSSKATFENPVLDDLLVTKDAKDAPWVFNPKSSEARKTPPKRPFREIKPQEDPASKRAMDLIQMQHAANEQDAENNLSLRDSLMTLDAIDKNIKASTKLMGRSRTVGLLPKVGAARSAKGVYKNTLGNSVSVG